MARVRNVVAPELPPDQGLPGTSDLGQDPEPGSPRRRTARKATTTRRTTTKRGSIGQRTSTGRIMSKSAQMAKVRDELYMWGSLIVGTVQLRDPCADMMFETVKVGGEERERLDAFVERLTSIIARNDRLLTMAASSGIIGEIAALATLLYPVAREVVRVHGPGGHGHRMEGSADVDPTTYPAWTGSAVAG